MHEHHDGLEIHPPAGGPKTGVAIDTYQDHRMAMAFALVGDVEIRDPARYQAFMYGVKPAREKAGWAT